MDWGTIMSLAGPMLQSGIGGAVGQATQGTGTPGYTGYDIIQAQTTPAYDYSARGLENLATGQMPQYWQTARPKIKKGMVLGQQEAYYGSPGNRYGAYQTGMESGALTGLGAGATQKSLRPLAQKYMDESRKIEEFLSQQDVGVFQNAEQNYLGTIGGYRPFQIAPYTVPGTEAQQSQWGSIIGNADIPWGKLGDMFNKTGGSGSFVNDYANSAYTSNDYSTTPLTDRFNQVNSQYDWRS
jgi:hypothetical protein